VQGISFDGEPEMSANMSLSRLLVRSSYCIQIITNSVAPDLSKNAWSVHGRF